jgi:hypothetical protein
MNAITNPNLPGAPGPVAVGTRPNPLQLDAATPILLLPVNIETRFMTGANQQDELWVRIYPDQIAINSHEPELTPQEILDGTSYWDAVWRAGNPPPSADAVKAPWRGLASLYGAPRAAWIVLQMTPANISAQPVAATADGTDPSPAPTFPSPATHASSWSSPAIASALPDAWTVVTVSAAATTAASFIGSPITPDLAVGLTPPAGAFPPGSPVDASMQWLTDFDLAMQAGMALKIPLTAEQRTQGFARIFVFGVRASDKDGAETLTSLLNAHHYSDGFSLLAQGAPTNNTPDVDSAYSRKDVDFEVSFTVERQAALNTAAYADGNAFAKLIGIDPATMAHVAKSDGTCERNGKDMLGALWPATLGYFLSQMMTDVFTPAQIETARQYVLANVIPRGPIPPFRIGRVPYGVLPVTSLKSYPQQNLQGGTVEPALVNFLLRMWPSWLNSSSAAPHMQNTGDPDAQLVQVLGMDASSMTFYGREVLGDNFLWNYALFQKVELAVLNSWWTDHLKRGRDLLDYYSYQAWDPRVIHLGMAESSYRVPFPTVQSGTLSETAPLTADATLSGGTKGNYIQWLRQASVSDLQAENYPGPKPTALLYKILRQSLLLDYAKLATLAEVNASRLQFSQIKEQEIIGVIPQPAAPAPPAPGAPLPSLSVWEVLARPSIPNPALTWADYLVQLDPTPESPFAQLTDLRTSLDNLAALPTAELDRLFTETVDACSHRLDVWVTGIASAILTRRRNAQVSGVHIGAYGWVEEVRPSAQRAAVQGTELQAVQLLDQRRAVTLNQRALSLPTPVQPLEDNGGFILAPSQAQAAVAAVLRNGYMTHKGTSEEGQLSIDLSSERVRNALVLLEGVQQGQSLNALLGYLFEDGLHALQLDKYVQPFRDLFPVVGNKLTPSSDPNESVAASNVVDGLALRTAWDGGSFASGQNWGANLPLPGNPDQAGVIGVLQQLDDYADALADLSISEAVFQIIRGNFGQAGTLMDAVSKGARPPNPEVVNTPRGGLDLTHRVDLLFAGTPTPAAAWSAMPATPRSKAEPWLNSWVGSLLPDPATVRCNITYQQGGAATVETIALSQLAVQPLDVLAMSDVGQTSQRGELENRILLAAALPMDATDVQVLFQPAGLPAGSILFPDAFYLAKTLRTLIGSGRALAPQDLTVPEKDAGSLGGLVNLTELNARATAAIASLTTDLNALNAAAPGLPGTATAVRSALLACSLYGVPNSIPFTGAGADALLATQATSVAGILQDRLNTANAVNLATAQAADLSGILTTVFGADFVVLPLFTPPDFASLQSAFGQSASLVSSDPQTPQRWLTQLTQIRPAISRLDAALTLSQLLGSSESSAPSLLLGQLPAVAGDKWLALGIDPANPPAKGRVALACLTQGDPVNQNQYAGLLLDEWPERIPSTQEDTAVAFHYEEPKARAPQAVLLAVCPDDRKAWDNALLLEILQETLELAKIRTVDLDSIQQVGQILPALYFALNLQGATPSINFATVKEYGHVALDLR